MRRTALVVALAVVAVLGAGGRDAAARAPDKTKAAAATPAPTAKQRTAAERKLRARVGKPPEKLVNLWNARTQEWLALDAKAGAAAAVPQPVADDFFRCHFTNQRPTTYDRRLIGIVLDAALHFGTDTVYVVSGFRAPKYNLQLRKKGREVARDSQHTYGHAVDFKLPGVATTTLRDWLKGRRLGGVGYYPESAFVHADVGKIRYWVGR